MPLRNEGISQSHESVICLLLQLSNCPTGEYGVNTHVQNISRRIYYTKQEAEQSHLRLVEDQILRINKEVKEEI